MPLLADCPQAIEAAALLLCSMKSPAKPCSMACDECHTAMRQHFVRLDRLHAAASRAPDIEYLRHPPGSP